MSAPETRAAASWAVADLRGRWRSLVALGLLLGLAAGLAMAAAAGSRRTATAVARLRSQTHAADAIVFPGQVGVLTEDWTKFRAQPEIAQLARWDLVFGVAKGIDGEATLFGAADDQWLNTVDRPVVVSGRMFNPKAPDEMVIGLDAVKSQHLRVGSVIHLHAYANGQDDTTGDPPAGPEVDLHIVGVVKTIHEFLFVPGMGMLSPAFQTAYGSRSLVVENGMVRLRRGAADVPAAESDASALVAPGTPVDNLLMLQRRVDTTLDVERAALALLALAVAIAGLILVAQALGRSVSVIDDDLPVLRAMGFDRRALVLSPVLSHLVAAVAGVGIAFATAVVASRWFPIGLGARIDPRRGMHADWVVLGPGIALVLLFVLAYVAFAAWRIGAGQRASASSSVGFAAWMTRVAPLTVAIATALAFRRAARRVGVTARPAVAGAIVGVVGVVGTVTINHGMTDALSHPARAGVTWDATVMPQATDRTPDGSVDIARVRAIGNAKDVAAAAVVLRRVSDVGAAGGTPTYAFDVVVGSIQLVTTAGRAPRSDDEAALGPDTARRLNVHIGDTISVGSLQHRVRVVGEALFPSDVHASFDEGLWVTPGGMDAMEPPPDPSQPAAIRDTEVAVRLKGGGSQAERLAGLTKTLGTSVLAVAPTDTPPELSNLRNIRTLPRLLAGFLALLALSALAHVLATSVRRRRRDLAVLRALGMTGASVRAILCALGSMVAVVGLAVGIPLGIVVGRLGWRLVTDRVPLEFVEPVSWLALLLVPPAAIAVVNLLAVAPGRAAARLRPAEVLRTE